MCAMLRGSREIVVACVDLRRHVGSRSANDAYPEPAPLESARREMLPRDH